MLKLEQPVIGEDQRGAVVVVKEHTNSVAVRKEDAGHHIRRRQIISL